MTHKGGFMKKSKVPIILLLVLLSLLLSSCEAPRYLQVKGVAYQSITSDKTISHEDIPSNAKIIVYHWINSNGSLEVTIQNNTDDILTIDRTKSFFTNGYNNAIPYYDPTVVVKTQSVTQSNTTGGSVNLGSVAGAVGVGGALGTALNGVTVGGANTTSTTNTNTTYKIDQPQLFVGPHSKSTMGREFFITGIGTNFLSQAINSTQTDINNNFTSEQTYASANICISYSFDDGKTFNTIISNIHAKCLIVSKVKHTGKVNDALRYIYKNKSDALSESWYLLYFDSPENPDSYSNKISFINYK